MLEFGLDVPSRPRLRYLDCQTHYEERDQLCLARGLQANSSFERRIFFEQTNQSKRRLQVTVADSVEPQQDRLPLGVVLACDSEFDFTRRRAVGLAGAIAMHNIARRSTRPPEEVNHRTSLRRIICYV